jgi:hypothetical protein
MPDGEIVFTLEELQVLTERWRWRYNHVRPIRPEMFRYSCRQRPAIVVVDPLAEEAA